MFVDAPFAQLVVFAIGQLCAWLYLRTGRFWLGTAATTALWGALDWWLVGRYLFEVPLAAQRAPLLLLQAVSLATTVAFVWARIRRRAAAGSRPARFRAGVQQLLADQLDAARSTFRALAWADPWDVSAWIALGDTERRLGSHGAARRCYRRALAVDTKRAYADLLQQRRLLLQARPAGRAHGAPAADAVAKAQEPVAAAE